MLLKNSPVQVFFSRLISEIGDFFGENPYGLSLTEVIFTLLVSNFALIFLIFAYVVDTPGAVLNISTAGSVLRDNFRPTETLVYLLALLAPALWMMAYNWRARKHVGFYWVLLIIQALIVIGSAYIYGKANSTGVANDEFARRWALICLSTGVVIWYVTLVYRRKVLDKLIKEVDDHVHDRAPSDLMAKLKSRGVQ